MQLEIKVLVLVDKMFVRSIYIFYVLFITGINAENIKISKSTCSTLANNLTFPVNCSITSTFPENVFYPICINSLRQNTLILQIPVDGDIMSRLTSKHGNLSISFSCASHYPLGMNLDVDDTEMKISSENIWQRRFIREYNNTSTYNHKLTVSLPQDSFYRDGPDKGSLIRYEVFNFKEPKTKFQLFFEYYMPTEIRTCRVYHIQKLSTEITQQVVTIPCISFFDDSEWLPGIRTRRGPVTLGKVDDRIEDYESVPYDKTLGFLLNISNYSPTGTYYCEQSQCQEKSLSVVLFKDFEITPTKKHIYLTSAPRFSILKGKLDELDAVAPTCTSFKGKVQFMVQYGSGLSSRILADKNKPLVNFSSSSHAFSHPIRYLTTTKIRYMNKTERRKVRGFMSTDLNSAWDWTNLHCLNSTSSEVGSLFIHFDEQLPLYYLHEHNVFVCDARINYGHYGYNNRNNYTSLIRMWDCKSFVQCQYVMSHCIQTGMQSNSPVPAKCAKHIEYTKTGSCSERRILSKTSSPLSKYCDFVVPGEKGIVDCGASSSRVNTEFSLTHSYFVGFDSIMYFELDMMEEPPLDAILRIISLGNEEYFYTKGRFSFKCEAHSYFYNEGLQWFIEFANGTTKSHLEETKYEYEDHSESYNPESKIALHFHYKTTAKIICSAPHLTTMDWSNVSMRILIEESIPAKITSTESEIYFVDNGLDQGLTCYSNGRPRPKVKWTKNNESIDSPLRVIDEITLFFPNYNSSFAGEYTCTADNVAGQDIKKFVVKTKSENASTYYTAAAIGISLFVIIGVISIFWFVYYQKETKKKEKEMEELISLLNGMKENLNDGEQMGLDDNVTKRLFDVQYEIEKNTFYIDRANPLGKGAYGQVYKGYLDGVDGAVAFKTLAPNSPMIQLKALISELKILMYIGPHDNLVTMLGAYRKEIRKGILHLAMELCGWGSLESFLKSNKHLFIKYLNSSANSENAHKVYRNSVLENSVSYNLYSIKNLFKWCAQVANGMEYLGVKKVIHADLAIRNILLTAEGNAKVTDFGLSRRTFNYSEYVKQGNDPLPWRYLAIESLVSKVYTCQSDVWSYGITLWEIFSLGEIPYPGFNYTLDFTAQIENGMRNIQPKYATEGIYDLMCRCWNLEPTKRPTFSSLRMIFKSACDSEKRNADIQITKEMDIEDAAIEMANADYTIIHEMSAVGNIYTK